MRHPTIALAATMVLAACNSGPTITAENASVAEVAESTRDAVKLKPGKWETTVALVSMDGPGLPPGMADAMKQQKAQTVETCLTPEQAAKPPQDMLGAAKNCTYEKFAMSGGTMSGTMVCKGMPGMPTGEMRASMSGTFADSSYDFTSEATMTMPQMPGGPAGGGKVMAKTKVSGRHLGDCDAKAG